MTAEAWWIVAAALVVEALIRWPQGLPHPVVWIGRLIAALERDWNKAERSQGWKRAMGVLSVLILLFVTIGIGLLITSLSQILPKPWSFVVMVACGTCGLAAGSLWHHIKAIEAPLYRWDTASARTAVGMVVGRDTHDMDERDIATAAIESLAESFNDGVVAPVFWFLLAGLPGLFAYKAINTADSMIGHMEPRWRAFGWAAAKTDDLMNWIPARIAGVLIALAGMIAGRGLEGWQVMGRDARKHASPNAGWTEAAMGGALGVRLGGEVRYDGQDAMRPVLGEGEAPKAHHLKQALRLYLLACGGLLTLILIGGFAWLR